MHPSRNHIYIGALIVALALILCLATVRACTSEEEVTAPAPVVELQETVPAMEAPTTTTTAVVAPLEPLEAEPVDPWGPILCEGAPHPAHHQACVPAAERPQSHTTETRDEGMSGGEWHSTRASFYSTSEMGSTTASGIALDDSAYTTAHRTLAFGTVLTVCHEGSCISGVVVTDRGPFIGGRDLDLSRAAFVALAGGTGAGVISVTWQVAG